jgi:hypothetical protein
MYLSKAIVDGCDYSHRSSSSLFTFNALVGEGHKWYTANSLGAAWIGLLRERGEYPTLQNMSRIEEDLVAEWPFLEDNGQEFSLWRMIEKLEKEGFTREGIALMIRKGEV